MPHSRKPLISLCVVLLFIIWCPVFSQNQAHQVASSESLSQLSVPVDVPQSYRSLYKSLQKTLIAADKTIVSHSNGNQARITFAAHLNPANSNLGTALLQPQTLATTRLYLDQLKELGVNGVKISLNYPLLTPNFPNASSYLDFYKQVVDEVRKRQMKVDIHVAVIFANTPFSNLPIDYSGLTFDRFMSEDRAMLATILDELHPDYLTILSEPDTEATLTGLKEFNNPENGVKFVQYVLNGINKGDTLIGAGTGTWSPITYIENLAQNTTIDFISIHMYPVSNTTFNNLFEISELAKKYNKRLVLDECWLYKTNETGFSNATQAFQRDAYSFWAPLDQLFLKTMVDYSNSANVEFVAPFWSNYFFAYLPYTPALDQASYQEVSRMENQAVYQNLLAGKFSSTGLFYKQLAQSPVK